VWKGRTLVRGWEHTKKFAVPHTAGAGGRGRAQSSHGVLWCGRLTAAVVVRQGSGPAPAPRLRAWPRPLLWLSGPRGPRLAPILPQCREGERLGEQHLAELAARHRNRGPGIESTPEALLRQLRARDTDATCHLACWPGLRRPELQHLRPPTPGPADKHRPKEAPPMAATPPWTACHSFYKR
jgi:hypothetical protein